jgi:hypothetical protein
MHRDKVITYIQTCSPSDLLQILKENFVEDGYEIDQVARLRSHAGF